MNLVDDTGGSLAKDILSQDRQDAAPSLLANDRADGAEVGGICGDGGRVGAVQVRDAQDVSRAALGGAIETGARGVHGLALSEDLRGRRGEGDGREEGCGDGKELHFGCLVGAR
jgi:hypothetical protein